VTGDAIDTEALGRWLSANVASFAEPFTISKFPSGQSNPTYRIVGASGEMVLRRKPFGPLLPSAHAVDREYRLLCALHPLGFPVPEPLALCSDDQVIGAIFYVMEAARGRSFPDGAVPDFHEAPRTRV
jgi:aminoglycoside phosphotransferase (APT) family kinase protein